MTAQTRCLCDGGAYEVKEHPFLVNDACMIHGSKTADSRYQQHETLAEAIEAAAKAEYDEWRAIPWDTETSALSHIVREDIERDRENFRKAARRAIDAARPLLPETRALERIRALCYRAGLPDDALMVTVREVLAAIKGGE